MLPPARTLDERKRDTLDRLTHDVDAWVATASPDGAPYLMPLSFLWDGTGLLMSTRSSNPTLVNLRARALAHVSLGRTRDVVLITGEAELLESISDELADSFAAKAGFDPRQAKASYPYFRIVPRTIQAWREVNEIAGRDLMRDSQWLA